MWRLYLLLILDSLILQLPRCIIGFALRWCWHPPQAELIASGLPLAKLRDAAMARRLTMDTQVYGQDMDSAKWLGLLAMATDAPADWDRVMALINDDGSLTRSLAEPYPDDAVPFSQDMASGLILAVPHRLHRLTDTERVRLAAVWDRTTWQGWPLLTAQPGRGKRPFGRGHLWRPWCIWGCEDVLGALVWLYLGWRITGQRRYLAAYWAMRILQAPCLWLATSDAQVWLGRVYAVHSANAHSSLLLWYAGWRVTGSRLFRRALATAYKRHGHYSADACVLAGSVINAPGWREQALALITAALDKGTRPCPADKTYLSLIWPPAIVRRAGRLQPPQWRGADYLWERSPIKGRVLDDAYRARRGLDVIFPVLLMHRILGGRT